MLITQLLETVWFIHIYKQQRKAAIDNFSVKLTKKRDVTSTRDTCLASLGRKVICCLPFTKGQVKRKFPLRQQPQKPQVFYPHYGKLSELIPFFFSRQQCLESPSQQTFGVSRNTHLDRSFFWGVLRNIPKNGCKQDYVVFLLNTE